MLSIDHEITDNCFSPVDLKLVNDFFNKNSIIDEDYKKFILSNQCGIYLENSFNILDDEDLFLYCILGNSSEMVYDLICYNKELFKENNYVAIGLTLGDNIIAFKKGAREIYYIELGSTEKKKIADSFAEFVSLIK